ncbi:HNH endonuclease [Pseudonocardia endophytica]|uniref:Uncharacterized protein DUF222 n=1 Tax=Pseudonocardia endophytica TaxID=401976 RepID=A0A4V2PIN5_PSEEN|nr:DUF222 domain-containing protein [Pseudonocardia endophytica]TCK25366.1 uncharacterized protein DUF222 [Pseudonocardia endophytica]
MTAVADHDSSGPTPSIGARAQSALATIRAGIDELVRSCTAPEPTSRAALIDEIGALEALKSSLDAVQAEKTLLFARAEAAHQIHRGLTEPEKIQRTIAAQVGLVCRVSPTEGRTRVRVARDLHEGLDHIRSLGHAGDLSAHKIRAIVAETSHLDRTERSEVDRLLRADGVNGRDGRGVGKLRELAKRLATQVAPGKFRARCAAARTGRRVTLRPAADGMTDLTAHLPAEQGAACLAALQKAFTEISVDPAPLTRSRGQVMADTLVERLTGQTHADDVNIEIQIVVPIQALIDPDSPLPAEIPGCGPVPADLITTTTGKKAWRRLLTTAGIVIGGDSRRRQFTGFLAELIRARDRWRCTEAYCDAPAREIDHIIRSADGGPTTFDLGRGTCQFHNLLRELPDWQVERVEEGVLTTTPTGHTHLYRIPRAEAGPTTAAPPGTPCSRRRRCR